MAIIHKSSISRPEIDLRGPGGNAFSLMGNAQNFGKQLGFSKEKISGIIDDMMSGDYQHLIEVFDTHFGEYVDLVNGEDEDDDY